MKVCTQAWNVRYADAIGAARAVEIGGVRVPFLGLDELIASKEAYREVDAWDRTRLLELKHRLAEAAEAKGEHAS